MPNPLRFLLATCLVLLGTACLIIIASLPAAAHQERPVTSPPRPGSVPDIARVNPSSLIVCKPTSKPTAAQLTEIQNRLATAAGDELAQARRTSRPGGGTRSSSSAAASSTSRTR